MGLIADWLESRKGVNADDWAAQFELIYAESKRLYLKKITIDSVLNYVARTMSTARFKINDEKFRDYKEWDYILNMSRFARTSWIEIIIATLARRQHLVEVRENLVD